MAIITKLNEKEIIENTENQIRFLTTVYPQLSEDGYQDFCIEIRPIRRTPETPYIKSLNLWKLDDEGVSRLLEFNKKINGLAMCVYYSSFTLDYKIETEDKIKGKINNNNAKYTTILPLDFDDLTMSEIAEQFTILDKLEIETIRMHTGHGFQCLILLNKKIYDTKILKKWTNLLIQKGLKVDGSIIDCARVLRFPYTNNCKAFDIKNKYYEEIDPIEIPAQVWEWTEKRYDLIDVFERVMSLNDILPITNEEMEEIKNIQNTKIEELIITKEPTKKTKKSKEIFTVVKNDIEIIEQKYGHILNIKTLPDPVVNMLYKTTEGIRNDTLLFLVPYLRNSLKLSNNKVIETIEIWGSRCTPAYEKNFAKNEANRLLNYDNNYKYGKYTEGMKAAFGDLEIHVYRKNNTIEIPNDIFDNGGIKKISDCAFKIYLYLELNKDKQTSWTMQEIAALTSVSLKTIKRNIRDLVRTGYLRRRKSYKRNKESYKFHLSDYRSRATGVTIFNKATLKLMLMELEDNEIKLYAYLYRMLNKQLEVTASQQYLSSKIDKTQTRISRITTSLNNKGYLNKITTKTGNKLPKCIYNIEI